MDIPGNAWQVLKKYAENIQKDPTNPKYRKIRLANARFAAIWNLEDARALLLSTGWQTDIEDGFIVLPSEYNAEGLLEMATENAPPPPTVVTPSTQTPTKPAPKKTAAPNDAQQQALLKMKKDREEMARIKAQIAADRAQVATRRLQASHAQERQFGNRITRYGDIGVDLNAKSG
eukprot:m.334909 g.334909  ORF g.334909 m.334909 type:complete len:175 (+) comp17461_c0_seq1:117-641(+)